MDWLTWYNSLEKPSWTPAPRTIGTIWQILYPVIIVTFGFVFQRAWAGAVPWWCALPFAIAHFRKCCLRQVDARDQYIGTIDRLGHEPDDVRFKRIHLFLR